MLSQAHKAKAGRLERSLQRLSPADYEIRIDGAMLAATHYMNLALHTLGLTPPERDVIHTEFLRVIEYRRFVIAAPVLVQALEDLELLRPPYVRGDEPGGPAAGEAALELLKIVRREADTTKPLPFPIVDYVPKPVN
jgi:hypothetical protein